MKYNEYKKRLLDHLEKSSKASWTKKELTDLISGFEVELRKDPTTGKSKLNLLTDLPAILESRIVGDEGSIADNVREVINKLETGEYDAKPETTLEEDLHALGFDDLVSDIQKGKFEREPVEPKAKVISN